MRVERFYSVQTAQLCNNLFVEQLGCVSQLSCDTVWLRNIMAMRQLNIDIDQLWYSNAVKQPGWGSPGVSALMWWLQCCSSGPARQLQSSEIGQLLCCSSANVAAVADVAAPAGKHRQPWKLKCAPPKQKWS